jgi:EAL and modified HD-GYP domain-containing signal transduction protein
MVQALEAETTQSAGAVDLSVAVGRQPIFTMDRNVFAYELLFRRPGGSMAEIKDADGATAQVIVNTLLDIGLERVAGNEPVFLNCTRHFLEHDPVLPPDRCVLEVLEDIAVDGSLVDAVKRLRDKGYRIALDDFVYKEEFRPLVELADFVKVDVLAHTPRALAAQAAALRPYGMKLLAEKVESEEVMVRCHELGFELFQGYFLRKPETLKARRPPMNRLGMLCVLSKCRDPKVSLSEIGKVIATDVTLSYRLLQIANSPLFPTRMRVESIDRAVSLMGTEAVFRWATVLVMAGFDDCPKSYLELALQRARMCELLAERMRRPRADRFYTAGLLSLLDAMLRQSMQEIVGQLPLDVDIRSALLSEPQGDVLPVLEAVLNYELGNQVMIKGIAAAALQQTYWEATEYSRQLIAQLGNA